MLQPQFEGSRVFPNLPEKGGTYEFDIGTTGGISLLLQCIAPVDIFSASMMRLKIIGVTTVRWSPPIRILNKIVREILRQMGLKGEIVVHREGFYPKGGGLFDVTIDP